MPGSSGKKSSARKVMASQLNEKYHSNTAIRRSKPDLMNTLRPPLMPDVSQKELTFGLGSPTKKMVYA